MSFFNYDIYSIPEVTRTKLIKVDDNLAIITREDGLGAAEKELLVKILASVQQTMDNAQLISLSNQTTCRIESKKSSGSSPLIIVFGLQPADCSLQVDKKLYTLITLNAKVFLFSHSLSEIASLNDCKRALWIALKQYFNKD